MKCSVVGCEAPVIARKLCSKHYQRMRAKAKDFKPLNEYHGYDGTPTYKTWMSLRARCNNQKDKDYKNYGGRGISVCDRWNNSFIAFLEDMGEKPFKKAMIDRVNNEDGYYKENCRWTTITENNRNRRSTKLTMAKAREIRRLYNNIDAKTRRLIAAQYGVNESHIRGVLANKYWREDTV